MPYQLNNTLRNRMRNLIDSYDVRYHDINVVMATYVDRYLYTVVLWRVERLHSTLLQPINLASLNWWDKHQILLSPSFQATTLLQVFSNLSPGLRQPRVLLVVLGSRFSPLLFFHHEIRHRNKPWGCFLRHHGQYCWWNHLGWRQRRWITGMKMYEVSL